MLTCMTVVSMLCLIVSAAACNPAIWEEIDKHMYVNVHFHKMTAVERVEPTCAAEGNVAYWHCIDCGKNYEDEKGAIELADVVIKATGKHVEVIDAGVEATCTTAGKTEGKHCSACKTVLVAQEEIAALGHTSGGKATCTTAEVCTACDEILVNALGHKSGAEATCTTARTCTECSIELAPALGHTPGAAATCTTAQICTVCQEELTAALGHTPGAEATCTTAQICTVCQVELTAALGHKYATKYSDQDHWKECETCKNKIDVEKHALDATGACACGYGCQHDAGTPATCTKQAICSKCNNPWGEVDKDNHTPGAAATCTTAQTCTECKAELKGALGHTEGAAVEENKKAAECVNAGSYDVVVYCTECKEELKRETKTLDALGHTAGAAATCTTAQICTVCQEELTAALGHTPGAEATCTAAQICTVCKAELSPILAHTYETKYDDVHHWTACACGAATEKVAHTGGTATVTQRPVCEACNQPYGTNYIIATDFALVAEEGVPYGVITGAYGSDYDTAEKAIAAIAAVYMDVQQYSTNNKYKLDGKVTITPNDGVYTVKINLKGLSSANGWFIHLGNDSNNWKPLQWTAGQAITVDNVTYTLNNGTLSWATSLMSIWVTYETTYTVTKASIAVEESAPYFVIEGTWDTAKCNVETALHILKQIPTDIQQYGSWKYVYPTPVCSLTEDGVFTVKLAMSDLTAHATRVWYAHFDGKTVSGVDVAANAIEANGATYTLVKGSTLDTSWMTELACVSVKQNIDIKVTGASLAEVGGIAYFVINGTWNKAAGNVSTAQTELEKNKVDFQQYGSWSWLYPTAVYEAKEDGTFTVSLPLTETTPHATRVWYSHFNGNNVTGVEVVESTLTVGAKTYKLVKGSTLDTSWMTELACVSVSLNAEATLTWENATLAQENDVAYFVVNGKWTSEADAAIVAEVIKFNTAKWDLQLYKGGRVYPTPIVTANEDGTFAVKLSLEKATADVSHIWYSHRNGSTNINLPVIENSFVCGNKVYSIVQGSSLESSWMSKLTCISIKEVVPEGELAIAAGGQAVAYGDPGAWYFYRPNTTNLVRANVNERGDTVRVQFTSSTTSVQPIKLFYNAADLEVGDTYTLSFTLQSPVDGYITVNSEQVEIVKGENKISVTRMQPANGATDMNTVTIQFGAAIGETTYMATGEFTLSKIAYEADDMTALTAPAFTFNAETLAVSIPATEADAAKVGSYVLGLFADGETAPVATYTVTNGTVIDVSQVPNGIYTVKVRAMTKEMYYKNSVWADNGVKFEVGNVKTEITAKGQEASYKSPGNWYYYMPTSTKLQEAYIDNTTGSIHASFTNTSNHQPLKLFYNVDPETLAVGEGYTLTLTITSPMAGTIIINGQTVVLEAGDNEIDLELVQNGNSGNARNTVTIQFGKEEVTTNMTGTFVISNITVVTAGGITVKPTGK